MAQVNSPLLEVASLQFSYADKKDVLKGLELDIAAGECVGIIGPNGAGKTTLFLLICGLLRPAGGTVSVNGEPVVYKDFNPKVGYVFQNPDDQLFSPTVGDDVAFGPLNMGLPKAELESRVAGSLEKCRVSGLVRRPSHHLSGGEKRMVAIASVLSLRPDIIIYDEPTASLDMRARRDVINLIRSEPNTSLVASHDLEFIREISSRVVLINNGVIAGQGTTDQVLADRQLMESNGLEVPYSLRA